MLSAVSMQGGKEGRRKRGGEKRERETHLAFLLFLFDSLRDPSHGMVSFAYSVSLSLLAHISEDVLADTLKGISPRLF